MRNMLALIGAIVVLFVGLGWYLGWYSFVLTPGAEGKQRLQVDVDTNKITEDAKKVGQAANNVIQAATKDEQKGAPPADFVGPPAPADLPARQEQSKQLQFPSSMRVPGPLPGPNR
jgi:hypothetical protein